jgi:hypothetical protein
MRSGERDALTIDDAVAGRDVVNVPADAPAFLRLADHTAQRLRDQLVTEADADHRHLGAVRGADEILQRRDPVEFVVYAGSGAGDQDCLERASIRQRLASRDAHRIEGDRAVGRADHLLEHLRIGSVTRAIVGTDEARFDDGDA